MVCACVVRKPPKDGFSRVEARYYIKRHDVIKYVHAGKLSMRLLFANVLKLTFL